MLIAKRPTFAEAELKGLDRDEAVAVVRGEKPVLKSWSVFASFAKLVWASAAGAQDSFSDPAGSGPIVGAVNWLQGTLLGTVATVVAVIAVASVGLLMLAGRMNWRYGATVILGCFILFGAASIVGGIQSASSVGY